MSGSLRVLVVRVWFLASGCGGAGVSQTDSLHWIVPPVLPPGALIAVVSGDPTCPGPFTLLVSMPNGYRIPPHSHSFEHVEVKEGALLVGAVTGSIQDDPGPGSGEWATAPAGMHHFSIAKGGPWYRQR